MKIQPFHASNTPTAIIWGDLHSREAGIADLLLEENTKAQRGLEASSRSPECQAHASDPRISSPEASMFFS